MRLLRLTAVSCLATLSLTAVAQTPTGTVAKSKSGFEMTIPGGWVMTELGAIWAITPPKVDGKAADVACTVSVYSDDASAEKATKEKLAKRFLWTADYKVEKTDSVLKSQLKGTHYRAAADDKSGSYWLEYGIAEADKKRVGIICGVSLAIPEAERAGYYATLEAMLSSLRMSAP
jgi:hypothetical protein